MEHRGIQRSHEHTLTDNELQGIRSGAGSDMIDHALDNLAGTYERLPPVPTSSVRTIGKGIYRGVVDSMKTSAMDLFRVDVDYTMYRGNEERLWVLVCEAIYNIASRHARP